MIGVMRDKKGKFVKGHSGYWLGKSFTSDHLKKLSEAKKGKRPNNADVPKSDLTRMKMSEAHKGVKTHLWRGGITPINEAIRKSVRYKIWRDKVFKRDKYTCRVCGIKSGNGKAVIFHADHIKQFAYFPKLRFRVSNGRTLCLPCHLKTETHGHRQT